MKLRKPILLTILSVSIVTSSFAQHHHHRRSVDEARVDNLNYRGNVLSISPIGITDNGIAIGMTYERTLDKKGLISFVLPVFYSFNNLNDNNNYYYNYYNQQQDPSQMLYFYPGFKITPGGFGRFRYGVGPNFVVGIGNSYVQNPVYDNMGNYLYQEQGLKDRFVLGVMVNNSLNINASEHLYLGLEFGFGVTYINRINNHNRSADALAKLGFGIGYRF